MPSFIQDLDDVGDMPGEGRKGLLYGLLIADIGVDIFKQADLGTFASRDVHPGLGHAGQQPDGLQGDGLAAGVWAGDQQNVGLRVGLHVNGDHGFLIQQGMACLPQLEGYIGVDPVLWLAEADQFGTDGLKVLGVFGFGKDQVECGNGIHSGHQFGGV